jgi:Carboxypeptidase regulatory-like domain
MFTPKQRGEVGLSARYDQRESTGTSWFLVDPLHSAQRLYFLAGLVRDDASNALLPGVTVENLDGYARGDRAVTNENGHYRLDRMLAGETFSVRASKPGYSPVTLTYRVDSPIGPGGGNPPFLDFRLRAVSN